MTWPHGLYRALHALEEFAPITDLRALLRSDDVMPQRYDENVFDGWEMDIPSGYEIKDRDDGWLVTIYDRFAVPTSVFLSREGKVGDLP